jgi:outer membrane murein-binding lipoprotein Lpp
VKFTRLQRTVIAILAVGLVLVAAGGVVLYRLVDRAGDRADRAAAGVSDLRVRVDGLDAIKVQVDDALAQVRSLSGELRAGLTAGLTVNVDSFSSAVNTLAASLDRLPAGLAHAGDQAAANLLAAIDAAKGLVADLGRSLGPMDRLASSLSVPVRVDVHVLQPLVDDLLGLLPQVLSHLGAT